MPSLLPLIDRRLCPVDRYPNGQWDYFRFYLTQFDQTASGFEADIPATLTSIYRRGTPASTGQVSPSALITLNGGRYRSVHRTPATPPDPALWEPAEFEAFSARGFRPANAWYLNDTANIAYEGWLPRMDSNHE